MIARKANWVSNPNLEKRKYLFNVLQLNPATQADQIIASRQRMLGFAEVVKHDPNSQESADLRRRLIERIETIRSQFWIQPANELRAQLEKLPVGKFRDLKADVDRLRLILVSRNQINSLSQEKPLSINLLNTFKRLVMSTPRDAGKIKERYLREMSNNPNSDKVKRMVKMLRKKHPQIYEFESAWFDELLRLKTKKQVDPSGGYQGVSVGFEIPSWIIYLVIFVGIRILIAVFRFGGN